LKVGWAPVIIRLGAKDLVVPTRQQFLSKKAALEGGKKIMSAVCRYVVINECAYYVLRLLAIAISNRNRGKIHRDEDVVVTAYFR
jgi:hypothetical protein